MDLKNWIELLIHENLGKESEKTQIFPVINRSLCAYEEIVDKKITITKNLVNGVPELDSDWEMITEAKWRYHVVTHGPRMKYIVQVRDLPVDLLKISLGTPRQHHVFC